MTLTIYWTGAARLRSAFGSVERHQCCAGQKLYSDADTFLCVAAGGAEVQRCLRAYASPPRTHLLHVFFCAHVLLVF